MSSSGTSIPFGWTMVRLGDLGEWRGGGTPAKGDPRFWRDGSIPWVSPKDMKVDRIRDSEDHITPEAVEGSATNLVPKGSVLLVTRSGILERTLPVAVNDVPVTLNQDLKALTPAPGIDPTYVALAIRAFEHEVLRTCSKSGTTVASVEFPRLKDFAIPVAPPELQARIVAEIEKQFTRLDAGVEALKRLQAHLRRYRAAVLKAACEGWLLGPAPRHVAGSLDPSADLPRAWAWVPLPELGELNRGKSKHRPRDDPRLYGGKYPFIQTGDVRNSQGTIAKFDQTYSEVGLGQSRLWPAGTLCITIAANIAETGILTFSACFPDSVVGFITDNSRASARYVEFFLRTAKADLARYAPATAQKNINLETLRALLVPLPPRDEQELIVTEVERRFSTLASVERSVDVGLRCAARLRSAILKSAFTGELTAGRPLEPRLAGTT